MNRQKRFFKDLQVVSSTMRRSWPLLTSVDGTTLHDAIIAYVAMGWDLCLRTQRLDCVSRFTKWVERVLVPDPIHVISVLKEIDEVFLQSSLLDADALKRATQGSDIGFSFWRAVAPVVCTLLRCQDVGSARTLLVFLGRVTLRSLTSADDKAIEKFVATDSAIVGHPSRLLNLILRSWLGQWVMDGYPRHGKGIVAEQIPAGLTKTHLLKADALLSYWRKDLCLPPLPEFACEGTAGRRISRLCCVPKSLDVRRTICAEPAVLQFHQQAVLHSIVRYIDSHPYLSRRINLSRSDLNSDLAREGSMDGSFATIDLSSASDSIGYASLRSWFAHTSYLRAIVATRSRAVTLPDGAVLLLNKAFAMGSAVCFPTQCLIFAAMCEYAIMAEGDEPGRSRYRVYGDDIIIETKYAAMLVFVLEKHGFSINPSKTFLKPETRFRESCGGEWYNGIDAAPLRLSRRFAGWSKPSPSVIEACVELANATYWSGPILSGFIRSILSQWRAPIGCNADGFAFTWRASSNLTSRWDCGRQESFVTCLSTVASDKKSVLDQESALYDWFVLADDPRSQCTYRCLVTSEVSDRSSRLGMRRRYGAKVLSLP